MPVRKIPKTYRSISGRFPSVLNSRLIGYESKLERDFFVTLEFDRTILRYEEQPVRITGVVGGKKISYVPDCLIQYLDETRCSFQTHRRDHHGERAAAGESETCPPFGPEEIEEMSAAISPATGKAYGVQRVCCAWETPRSSFYYPAGTAQAWPENSAH